jgi:ubiquinone/menaquinone biosynthesis C-methylase UbiE
VLVELVERSYQPAGVDASKFMVDLARRRLGRHRPKVAVCQALAESLPFAPAVFDGVIATFPTAYIYDPAWIRHAMRVLKPGGRLAIIDVATFGGTDPVSRSLEWLYQVTGQRGPCPDLTGLLQAAGFDTHRHSVEMQGSTVSVVVATKGQMPRCARAELTE